MYGEDIEGKQIRLFRLILLIYIIKLLIGHNEHKHDSGYTNYIQ